ncbi:MAG: hypothetical protein Q4E63_01110 [Prevotellaceae bacterium]|nr:hypothetical protein [Prevotellaceae bacterium]
MNYPNIFRTLLFNLRAFGLRRGLKLPVYVYSRVKVYNMGHLIIKTPITKGMIRIGLLESNSAVPYTIWNNKGSIEFEGNVWINHGTRIKNSGTIVFHGNNILGYEVQLDIIEHLEIGNNTTIGFCSEVTDNDSHYIVDINTREIKPNRKPIILGNFNWITSHSYIRKGTITPDFIIVASPNSVLRKDYRGEIEPYTTLAGNPLHAIGAGKLRVYNFDSEKILNNALVGEGKPSVYVLPKDIDLVKFCAFK